MQPLAASKVTQWLVSVGYLVEQQSSDGRNAPSVAQEILEKITFRSEVG